MVFYDSLRFPKQTLGFSGSLFTLPETKIASENRPSQKEIHLPTIVFQVRAVSFRECIIIPYGSMFIFSVIVCASHIPKPGWIRIDAHPQTLHRSTTEVE